MSAIRIIEARLSKREFIVMMSALISLTALAIDMMLPAFGDMRSGFGLAEDSSAVAPVVTVFFIGLGTSQPLWGPLSDALGRKRILWIGLLIYAVSALGAVFSPSLGVLLLWRFLAAFGAGAVRVVTHGIIRDAYRGEQMAKTLSYIMAVFVLVPVIAPSVGSAVLIIGSWRMIFIFFLAAALAVGAWAIRLPETLSTERRIDLNLSRLIVTGKAIFTSRFAIGLIITQTAAFGFFASYLATSELIVADVFGLQAWFPIIFGGLALVLGVGMLFNPRLLDRFGLRRSLRFVLTGYLGGMLLFTSIALVTGGKPSFWLYLAGLTPVLLAQSFLIPNLNSAAMMPMGNIAGTAAAVIGSIVMLGGAAIGATIDTFYNGTITPFALGGALICIVGYTCYRWADAGWDDSAERELVPLSEVGQVTAVLSSDVS